MSVENPNELWVAVKAAAWVVGTFLVLAFGCSALSSGAGESPTREWNEQQCEELSEVLSGVYYAAAAGAKQDQILSGLFWGPEASESDKVFVIDAVIRVVKEYPGTKTGETVITECFANAQRNKGPRT